MTAARTCIFEMPLDRPELLPGLRLGRNWHCDTKPFWSRDRCASLTVERRVFPHPVPLTLTLCVFGAGPDRPRSLRIGSPGHDMTEVIVTAADPFEVALHTPVHQEGADITSLVMELDSIESPALHHMDATADERLLGVRIVDAVVRPDLTFPLDFSDPATCAALLRDGWTRPEPGLGCWSLGNRARLVLPAALRPAKGGTLVFDASALPRPECHAPLAVDLECGGTHLATWRSVEESAWQCPLPPGSPDTDVEISLTINGAASPASLGLNADTRMLGLLLKRIDIRTPRRIGPKTLLKRLFRPRN